MSMTNVRMKFNVKPDVNCCKTLKYDVNWREQNRSMHPELMDFMDGNLVKLL